MDDELKLKDYCYGCSNECKKAPVKELDCRLCVPCLKPKAEWAGFDDGYLFWEDVYEKYILIN